MDFWGNELLIAISAASLICAGVSIFFNGAILPRANCKRIIEMSRKKEILIF
jgi:hypothetical protein